MPIRFVIDENMRAIGKALVEVRSDVTYFGDDGSARKGRGACPITLGMNDEDWLPIVGASGWSVITRDKHIRTRPGEIAAVRAHGIRVFAITSANELNRWEQLDILVRRWPQIERHAAKPGPLICAVTYASVTPLNLV
jgi:hypothetical protein